MNVKQLIAGMGVLLYRAAVLVILVLVLLNLTVCRWNCCSPAASSLEATRVATTEGVE